MKKGFTLIELLAVIVILAIIALIATPIILGIINDARKESNERSAELYASAVKNAIASYQLTHPNAPATFSDLDIQYDGEVECAKEELYADGSFYITDCTVNGTEVDYIYGEQQSEISDVEDIPEVEEPSLTQVYKPQYYSIWSSGSVGDALPSAAKKTVSELNSSYPVYLGFDEEDGKVTTAYVCFTKNNIEYCLKSEQQEDNKVATYELNNTVLLEVFGVSGCSFDEGNSNCSDSGLSVNAYPDGNVNATDGNVVCDVGGYGGFECFGL